MTHKEIVETFLSPALSTGAITRRDFKSILKRLAAPSPPPKTTQPAAFCHEQVMTLEEAAKTLKVSKRTISRMLRSRRLQGIKITGSRKSLRVTTASIQAMIANNIDDREASA